MEGILQFVCENADNAHWIFLGLLFLAGLNVPISEDLILLTAGALASTCLPADQYWHLYFWVFLGSWVSAWECYAVGYFLGPKLYQYKWFNWAVTPERIEKLHYYYDKFHILTFIVVRYCPGGVRNAFFLSAGLGKMPFLKFILRDGFAAFLATNTLYYIGYQFGKYYDWLVQTFIKYNQVAILLLITIIGIAITYFWLKKKKNHANDS